MLIWRVYRMLPALLHRTVALPLPAELRGSFRGIHLNSSLPVPTDLSTDSLALSVCKLCKAECLFYPRGTEKVKSRIGIRGWSHASLDEFLFPSETRKSREEITTVEILECQMGISLKF